MPIHKINLPHSPMLCDAMSPLTFASPQTRPDLANTSTVSSFNMTKDPSSTNDSFNSLHSHANVNNNNNNTDIVNNNNINNTPLNTSSRSVSGTSINTPHFLSHNNSYNKSNSFNSLNMLKSSTKSLSALNKSTISSTSLHSMLSNHTATTEYSPNLIENECGDLLKIVELDLSNENNGDDDGDDYDSDNNTNHNHTLNNEVNTIDSFLNPQRKSKANFNLNNDDEDDAHYHVDDSHYLSTDSEYSDTDVEDIHVYEDLSNNNHNNVSHHTPLRRVITSNDVCGSCNHTTVDTFYQNSNSSFIDYSDKQKWNKKEKWAFVLIGLPACGKSTMIHDFKDYVENHTNSKIRVSTYNAGDIRRIHETENHHKFNFNDLSSSQTLRDFYAFEALKNLTDDLINDKIDIGILDATNTTKKRRKSVLDNIKKISEKSKVTIKPLFFEVKTSNKALRRYNIEQKSKNKDYVHMDREVAINDFLERIHKYELSYDKVTLDEIKSLNVKYFGIDNVGDSIYYDCGLDHHNNSRHKKLTFSSIALNLLYQFLINYRTLYAAQYLTDVDHFYTAGHYIPIQTVFSRPVTPQEIANMKKTPSEEINSVSRGIVNPSHNQSNATSNTSNFTNEIIHQNSDSAKTNTQTV